MAKEKKDETEEKVKEKKDENPKEDQGPKDLQPEGPKGIAPLRVSGKDGPAGFEEMDFQQDIQMPRVAILQGLSKMAIEGKAPAGKIVNALTKEVYGDELIFIPLFLFKTRAKFERGKGLVCMSREGITCAFSSGEEFHSPGENCLECPDAAWPEKGKLDENELGGPPCSMVYNYPVLNCGDLSKFPASISLMRTATKPARVLNSLLRFTGEDFFASKCKLTSSLEKGAKGDYFKPEFEIVGKVSDEEYEVAKKWFKLLRGKTIEVDLEQEAPSI